jgi:hypothetical protein
MVYNINNKYTIVQLKPKKLHKFYLPKLRFQVAFGYLH